MARNSGAHVRVEDETLGHNLQLPRVEISDQLNFVDDPVSLPAQSSLSDASHSLPAAGQLRSSSSFRASTRLRVEQLVAANQRVVELREKLESVGIQGSSKKNRIKRPRNAFILYCLDERPTLQRGFPGADNRLLSKMLGIMWKELSSVDKSRYTYQAAQERARISAVYPNCKFPIDKSKKLRKRLKKAEEDLAQISTSCPELIYREDASVQEIRNNDDGLLSRNSSPCSKCPAAEWVTMNESLSVEDGGTSDCLFSELVDWPMWNCSTSFAIADADSSGLLLDSWLIDDITTDKLEYPKQETDYATGLSRHHRCDALSANTTTALLKQEDVILACPDSLMCNEKLKQQSDAKSTNCCELGTTKRSKRERKKHSPYMYGCRRFYGTLKQDSWCSGCRYKKRCRRNVEQLK